MRFSRRSLLRLGGSVAVLAAVAGCSTQAPSKFRRYDGPQVTRVLVFKNSRRMYLMHHDTVLQVYDVNLGFAPR